MEVAVAETILQVTNLSKYYIIETDNIMKKNSD